MKARKVKGLEPDGPLAHNALRIVRTRIDELHSFADAARDPADVVALHDMRIAAKRVRYLLELVEPCLGKAARGGAKEAKALQTLLGDVHDCDELLPMIDEHMARLRAEDVAAVRGAAGDDAEDLDPELARSAPNRAHYRGLEALRAYVRARREILYARFLRDWARIERGREQLERDLERAAGDTMSGAGSEQGAPT